MALVAGASAKTSGLLYVILLTSFLIWIVYTWLGPNSRSKRLSQRSALAFSHQIVSVRCRRPQGVLVLF